MCKKRINIDIKSHNYRKMLLCGYNIKEKCGIFEMMFCFNFILKQPNVNENNILTSFFIAVHYNLDHASNINMFVHKSQLNS